MQIFGKDDLRLFEYI